MPHLPRDWHQKSIGENPLFPKPKRSRLRRRIDLAILLCALGGWVYFLFFSPLFTISALEVEGLENIARGDIERIVEIQKLHPRLFLLPQENIFLFSVKGLEKRLASKYALEELRIEKKLPETLTIALKERISTLVWVNGDRAFLVDLSGVAFQALDEVTFEEAKKRFPTVEDKTGEEIIAGQPVLSPKFIGSVSELALKLPENLSLPVSAFVLRALKPTELAVRVEEGWELYFALEKDLDRQLQKLDLILKEKIKDRRNLEYIDLRFGEKIFYK